MTTPTPLNSNGLASATGGEGPALPLTPGSRRSVTLPTRFQPHPEPEDDQEPEETLFEHPKAKVYRLAKPPPINNSSANAKSSTPSPWKTGGDTLLGIDCLLALKNPAQSAPYFKFRDTTIPMMPNTEMWCIDDQAKFITLKYRIELPFEGDQNMKLAEDFKETLKKIIRYEETTCPFQRDIETTAPITQPEELGSPQRRPTRKLIGRKNKPKRTELDGASFRRHSGSIRSIYQQQAVQNEESEDDEDLESEGPDENFDGDDPTGSADVLTMDADDPNIGNQDDTEEPNSISKTMTASEDMSVSEDAEDAEDDEDDEDQHDSSDSIEESSQSHHNESASSSSEAVAPESLGVENEATDSSIPEDDEPDPIVKEEPEPESVEKEEAETNPRSVADAIIEPDIEPATTSLEDDPETEGQDPQVQLLDVERALPLDEQENTNSNADITPPEVTPVPTDSQDQPLNAEESLTESAPPLPLEPPETTSTVRQRQTPSSPTSAQTDDSIPTPSSPNPLSKSSLSSNSRSKPQDPSVGFLTKLIELFTSPPSKLFGILLDILSAIAGRYFRQPEWPTGIAVSFRLPRAPGRWIDSAENSEEEGANAAADADGPAGSAGNGADDVSDDAWQSDDDADGKPEGDLDDYDVPLGNDSPARSRRARWGGESNGRQETFSSGIDAR